MPRGRLPPGLWGAVDHPCPDTDGNVCTQAQCTNGFTCNQLNPADSGTPCSAGNECLTDLCNGTGQCGIPKANLTPCTDTGDNVCLSTVCFEGVCRQDFVGVPSNTLCPDTDGNVCTRAQCTDGFTCNQLNPADSGTPCSAGNECLTDLCNGTGQCGIPKANLTPCTDTGDDACLSTVCFEGVCRQDFVGVPPNTSCPDTDGNACTVARCSDGFTCNQQAVLTSGNSCDDGDACTTDDTCESGMCVAGPAVVCDDTDPCTIDRCENGVCGCSADAACAPQGCTPGYWKNNAASKSANAWPSPYTPGTLIGDVFNIPVCLSPTLGAATLSQGLSFKGWTTPSGAAQTLLRAGIAALLNSASLCVQYPLCPNEVISQADAALASCNAKTMLSLAAQLGWLNSLFCPLDQRGRCMNP